MTEGEEAAEAAVGDYQRESAKKDRGDIELLELIAKDPHAFILNQGWASVSLDPERGWWKRGHFTSTCKAKILELIETLDELRASADYAVFQFAEQDAAVIDSIAAAQREELERKIAGLKADARKAEKSWSWR